MTRTSLGAEVDLRPTRWLRVSSSLAWERIERQRDGSEFARTLIPRVKAEVQPSRPLFFRTIVEWRAEERDALFAARDGRPLLRGDALPIGPVERDGLRLDLLASYEPTPGTVAFLGYGTTLSGSDAFSFRPGRLDQTQDGFFLKLAYRFRR